MDIRLIIKIAGLILLLLAAFGVSARGIAFGWLGLFLWFLADII